MKIIKLKAENYNVANAHQMCLDIEAQLGVLLHKDKQEDKPEGYLETDSEGNITIYLYEKEDLGVPNG